MNNSSNKTSLRAGGNMSESGVDKAGITLVHYLGIAAVLFPSQWSAGYGFGEAVSEFTFGNVFCLNTVSISLSKKWIRRSRALKRSYSSAIVLCLRGLRPFSASSRIRGIARQALETALPQWASPGQVIALLFDKQISG